MQTSEMTNQSNKQDLDYDKFTLMHLIHILEVNDIPIECDWNKESILKMMESIDTNSLEYTCNSESNYKSTYISDDKSIISIKIEWDTNDNERMCGYFSFVDGDVITLPDSDDRYNISIIYDDYGGYYEPDVNVYCESLEISRLLSKMTAEDFVHMLENDEITIVQNIMKSKYMT